MAVIRVKRIPVPLEVVGYDCLTCSGGVGDDTLPEVYSVVYRDGEDLGSLCPNCATTVDADTLRDALVRRANDSMIRNWPDMVRKFNACAKEQVIFESRGEK